MRQMRYWGLSLLASLSALAGCGASAPPAAAKAGHYVFVVDRSFDSSRQPATPTSVLPEESYRSVQPHAAWQVEIDGRRVLLTPSEASESKGQELAGEEVSKETGSGERRFELGKGAFAGGRFVLRGTDGELTLFGSGVPVVASERGKLIAR